MHRCSRITARNCAFEAISVAVPDWETDLIQNIRKTAWGTDLIQNIRKTAWETDLILTLQEKKKESDKYQENSLGNRFHSKCTIFFSKRRQKFCLID